MTNAITTALLTLGFVLFSGSWSAMTPAQSRTAFPAPARFTDPNRLTKLRSAFGDIDRLFQDFTAGANVPGAAWGVVIDGQLVHSGASGYRDIASKAPATPDTVFRIASMTKSFTAMAILKLRDEGKLSLDDPAERHLPEMKGWASATADAPRITIRHLLTHGAGFPEDNPWGDQQLSATEEQFTEMLRQGVPFSNASGLAYEYSNFGFAILGRIVSRASGRPYRDYLRTEILIPLGMKSTTLEPSSVDRGRLALGYRREDEWWKDEPLLPDGAFGAMGGLLTSINDLGRYVATLMEAWPPRDGPEAGPVRRSSLREMQQLQRFSGATAARDASSAALTLTAGGYGYGLRVTQTCSLRHIVGHGGGLPGFGSLMQWLPEHGVGLIAFGNLTYTGWSRAFTGAFELLQKTRGLEARVAQPSAALVEARDAVSRLIMQWDDQTADRIAAVNLYMDQSKERRRAAIESLRSTVGICSTLPTNFDFAENALRGQWTMACERGRLRVAITLAPTMPPRVQAWMVRPAPQGEALRPGISCSQ
jgi:CubicO group peptidase (beta-lactamase class C family)